MVLMSPNTIENTHNYVKEYDYVIIITIFKQVPALSFQLYHIHRTYSHSTTYKVLLMSKVTSTTPELSVSYNFPLCASKQYVNT